MARFSLLQTSLILLHTNFREVKLLIAYYNHKHNFLNDRYIESYDKVTDENVNGPVSICWLNQLWVLGNA